MTDQTLRAIRTLLSKERGEPLHPDPERPIDALPVTRMSEWREWKDPLPPRWASLLALEDGDVQEAAVLAQLAISSAISQIRDDLYDRWEEDDA